jgi:FkbM family methyltransferase
MKKIVIYFNRLVVFVFGKEALESFYVYSLKYLNSDVLYHAHMQLPQWSADFENTGELLALGVVKNSIIDKTELTIFDVGANDGSYTLLLKSIFPLSKIKAFEPMPDTYELAVGNLANVRGVELFQLGFSECAGSIILYNDAANPNDQISTMYSKGLLDFYKVENLKEVIVQVVSIDQYCLDNGIDSIDFLKVDVEGAELNVLKGGVKMINNGKIRFIQFEFNDFNIISRTFMKDFYELLLGYSFYRVNKNGLVPLGSYKVELEIFKFQNILAVHNSINLN